MLIFKCAMDAELVGAWMSYIRKGLPLETAGYQTLALNSPKRRDARKIASRIMAGLETNPRIEDHTDGQWVKRKEFSEPLSECFAIIWYGDLAKGADRAPNPYRILVANICTP